MHMVVSWDIKAENPRWNEINEKLKAALQGFSWVRPLTTFYVVRVASDGDRTLIRGKLVQVASGVTENVHVVISPVMAGGQYDGYLPGDMWPKLNERSAP